MFICLLTSCTCFSEGSKCAFYNVAVRSSRLWYFLFIPLLIPFVFFWCHNLTIYIFSNEIASIFFPSFIYQEWISNLSGIPFVRFSPPTFSLYKPAISPNSDRMKCNICLLIHSLPTNKKYFLIADSISCPELEITGCSVPSRTYKWTFNAF